MTHFHLYIPSGILPSIKIPKIKLQKKLFAFGIGRTRDSYNVTTPRPDNTIFVPTISLQVHANVDENIVENNPDHVIDDKQKNQINCNLPAAASCIHSQKNLQNLLGGAGVGAGGGIILNIPLKANNARRAPRDMNHEKFTPCQRRFQQHENSITDCNKNVKFSKGTGPKQQGDQDGMYYEDICCSSRNVVMKIAPPPRKRKSRRTMHQDERLSGGGGTATASQPINQTFVQHSNSVSFDGCDFGCVNAVKSCHTNPNNKSDPWMVNVDYRKLEKPPPPPPNTNVSSTSHAFEDEFVNGLWNQRNVDEKREAFKQQRRESVNIFDLGNTINAFDDFDEIFDANRTVTEPEQLGPNYDWDRRTNDEMISDTHAMHMMPNKRTTTTTESIAKTVSFKSSDAYAKVKKEQINISQHNENVFQPNHGSENGFPTFEYSGNQNIAVNHMLNQDFAERGMRAASCAKRSGDCEWEMFEHCAIDVGNENVFSGEFSLEQFRNSIERNVFLDEKCLTIVLDLLESEWRTGKMNGK